MWVGVWLIVIFALGGGWLPAQERVPLVEGPYNRLVIRGAMVIDGTGAPPSGPVDIVIEKNVITEIIPVDPVSLARRGPGFQRPTGDRVIEGENLYVMPGIVDLHTHISDRVPMEYVFKLWLGHGVTSVRVFSIGSQSPEEMAAEKRRLAAPQAIAPRLYIYPFWRGSDPRLADSEGARALVREWKAKGIDGIKISGKPGLYPDVLKAICDEARKQGMGVAVHIGQDGVVPMNALEVARAGATTIEHHYGYAEAAFSNQTVQDLPAQYNYLDEPARFRYTAKVWLETDLEKLMTWVVPELLKIAQETGFVMDPTFAVYEANRDLMRVQTLSWHERFTLPVLMDYWRPNPRHHGAYHYAWTSGDEAVWDRMYRRWLEFVNMYKNRGGRVAVGSDAGSAYHLYGFGTIRELEMLERAGFHPLEVIRSATLEGARALGEARLGIIRPGYLADVLVLEENPLADFKVLYGTGVTRFTSDGRAFQRHGLKYTIRDGVVFDARALLREVEEMVRQAKARKP